MWKWLTGGAVLVVLTGVLATSDAADVLSRIAPVLLFLAAITVVAELSDSAGVFEVAADGAARAGRGSVVRLFLLIAVLSTATTVVLSLDTTAVLLTPIVITLADRLQLPAAPLAVLVLWLANTASLLLPVSNLTNLLAADRLNELGVSFPRLMVAPAAAVLAVGLLVVWVRYRHQLRGRYQTPDRSPVPDRPLFAVAAVTCVAIGVLVAVGADVTVVACAGALVLLIAVGVRHRSALRGQLVPWRLVLSTAALFLLVQATLEHGADSLLRGAAGVGSAPLDLLRLAATAAGASNLVNNLPAYLALEPDAQQSATRLGALLIGTNAGPLILPWGSLATLLWLDRCRARGVRVPVGQLALLGVVGVPLMLTAGVMALSVS